MSKIVQQLQLIARKTGKRLGLWTPADRNLQAFDDDTFLVSYPKSGNTWLRLLIANAITPNEVGLQNIDAWVPDIYQRTTAEIEAVPRPRVLKSHEQATPSYPSVIYLVRDPRDVAVSMYYWRLKTGSLPKELSGKGVSAYIDFFPGGETMKGGWEGHVESWLEVGERGDQRFLLTRFEDLKQDAGGVLEQVLEFSGISVDQKAIDRSVRSSAAENMKGTEIEIPLWLMRVLGKKPIPFVRKGQAGGWVEHFSEQQRATYAQEFGDLLSVLGYEL